MTIATHSRLLIANFRLLLHHKFLFLYSTHQQVFHFEIFLDAMMRAFAPDPGFFDAAKGRFGG